MPPKQKKPPKNSYYFYMVKRKRELERQGFKFPRGMADVANAVGAEWSAMSAEDKRPYEEEAKEAKGDWKTDDSNKFTSTGESFAHVQRRILDDQRQAEEQTRYTQRLGNEGVQDRVFVLIKTQHCVEQLVERNQRVYWPIEVGLVAFSLKKGLLSTYWTLVDIQKIPVGYASAVKESSEETGLPEPGTVVMESYRDYNDIMKKIEGFIKTWARKSYDSGPVVFALQEEIVPARGCLQWIANHVDDKGSSSLTFVDNLKIYKLPQLILEIAGYANKLNPYYENILVLHKIESVALGVINKGCYDYKDEITCPIHRTEAGSLKMFTCCRNIVLRRMFLLFEEFLKPFELEKTVRHDMEKLGAAQAAKERAERLETTSSQEGRGNSASSLKKAEDEKKQPKSPPRRMEVDDDDDDNEDLFTRSYPQEYVPWGNKRPVQEANFRQDDFPALGDEPSNSRGRGIGRGQRNTDDTKQYDPRAKKYY